MKQQAAGYQAYLLRLWLVEGGEQPIWRATLENAHTHERISFSDLNYLFTYLSDSTQEAARQIKKKRQQP